MDTKVRAGLCLFSTLLSYLVLKQDLTTSLLISICGYLFIESYTLKAASRSHLFIRKEETSPLQTGSKPDVKETREFSTLTEVVEEKVIEIEKKETKPAQSMTDTVKIIGNDSKVEATMTEFESPVEGKAEDTQTDNKELVEASTSNCVDLVDHFTSVSIKLKDFSCLTEISQTKVFTISLTSQVQISPRIKAKRNALVQCEVLMKNNESQTARLEFKDVDTQAWVVQDEQEVNTTMSLAQAGLDLSHKVDGVESPARISGDKKEIEGKLEKVEKDVKVESRPRSGSVEVIHDDYFSKEILISELIFERVTGKTGEVGYLFRTHLETELNVTKAFQVPPYCISLVDWTRNDAVHDNYNLLKDRFQNSERVVKIRTNEFNVFDSASFIDDPEFQYLYFGVYTNLLSHSSIYVIDSSNTTESFWTALKLKWNTLKDFSPLFFLHTGSNLHSSVNELSSKLLEISGIHPKPIQSKIALYDDNLKIFHLESGKTSSFNFIEEKILNFEFYLNFIQDEFDFAEYCKEHLKKTLKLILKSDAKAKVKSSTSIEDYGFNVAVKYKNSSSIPSSLIEKPIKEANILKIFSISMKNLNIESNFAFSEGLSKMKTRPLSCLFLALNETNFSDLFCQSSFQEHYLEVYTQTVQSGMQDELFPYLSSWVLGSFFADYIIIVIDFSKNPDLHHSDLLLKFFSVLKDSEKPIHILHKTSHEIDYQYSLARVNELAAFFWSSDKVIFHEEITDDKKKNSGIVELIKDQMNDNLYDPDSVFDLKESFKAAFENTVEMLMLIQNTRKRELLAKAEVEVGEDSAIAKCELEPTWKAEIRSSFQQFILKNIVYASPGQYHIDQNISSTIYSTLVSSIPDHLIKIAVFSNLPPSQLSHSYLSELSFCFSQNKEDTLLIFPSSRLISTSASNHLNTPEFNSIFLHKFIEKIADCVIISLFYHKGKLIDTFDSFAGLAAALTSRKANKPVMVLYHFDGVAEMAELSSIFYKFIKEFDGKISSWTGLASLNEIRIVENLNEGLYAFDSSKQIIHRMVVSTAEVIWKWYNGVLYKIMHNASLKNQVKPLALAAQEAFEVTLKETVLIFEDENVVDPDVQISNYLEMSWKALSSFSFKVFAEILPLWTITSRV